MPSVAIEAIARIRLLCEPGHGEPSLSRYSIYKIGNRHGPKNTFRAFRRGRRQFFRDGNLIQRHSRVSIDISKLYLSLKTRVKEARLNLSENYLESDVINVSFSMIKYLFTYKFHGKFVENKSKIKI